MNQVYGGKEAYEALIQAGVTLFERKAPGECGAEEITAAAGLPSGAFERFFDSVADLADVASDRLAKSNILGCAAILEKQGGVNSRITELFAYWDRNAEKIDRLRAATRQPAPEMKGHILTCIDSYTRLARAMEKLVSDGMAEGRFTVDTPAYCANAIAFGLLATRYSECSEKNLLGMVRRALDSLLYGDKAGAALAV